MGKGLPPRRRWLPAVLGAGLVHASGAFAPCRGLLPQYASAVPAAPVTALRALPLRSARRALLPRAAAETDEGTADVAALAETKKLLVAKYEGYLAGTVDNNGEVLPEWRIDNRQTKLEAQGSITVQTAPQRADEAIARTRQRFLESFLSDGSSREEAEARVDEFLSSPSLCVETIWEAERKRFVEEDKGLDSKAKLLVTLGNLALLPFVLLFINSLPVKESFMSAQFYLSNNCQANGGIKCNGVGAQGQGGPNIMKALTPPANGGKIIREKRLPPSSVAADEPPPAGVAPDVDDAAEE